LYRHRTDTVVAAKNQRSSPRTVVFIDVFGGWALSKRIDGADEGFTESVGESTDSAIGKYTTKG